MEHLQPGGHCGPARELQGPPDSESRHPIHLPQQRATLPLYVRHHRDDVDGCALLAGTADVLLCGPVCVAGQQQREFLVHRLAERVLLHEGRQLLLCSTRDDQEQHLDRHQCHSRFDGRELLCDVRTRALPDLPQRNQHYLSRGERNLCDKETVIPFLDEHESLRAGVCLLSRSVPCDGHATDLSQDGGSSLQAHYVHEEKPE